MRSRWFHHSENVCFQVRPYIGKVMMKTASSSFKEIQLRITKKKKVLKEKIRCSMGRKDSSVFSVLLQQAVEPERSC